MRETVEKEIAQKFVEMSSEMARIGSELEWEITSYTDFAGTEFAEYPACYNSEVTDAVARDVSLFRELLSEKYPEISEQLGNYANRLSVMNQKLDAKTEKISLPWDFDAGLELVCTLKTLAGEIDGHISGLSDKCRIWADRALYMNAWASYLEEVKDISECQKAVKNCKNGAFLLLCCNMRKSAAELFIRTVTKPDEHIYLISILGRLRHMCNIYLAISDK